MPQKGMISGNSTRGINLKKYNDALEQAFLSKPDLVAVAINSPGGSPVQTSLIHARIRKLAKQHDVEVNTFIEDTGASGGYWLSLAGDKIYADSASVVGSIGVVSSSFVRLHSCSHLTHNRLSPHWLLTYPLSPTLFAPLALGFCCLICLLNKCHFQFVDSVTNW